MTKSEIDAESRNQCRNLKLVLKSKI